MKARFYKNVSFGLALSAMPFVGACNQGSNAPQSFVTAAQAEPSPVVASNAVAATNTLSGPLAPEGAPVATPAPNAGKAPLPANIKPSPALGEIVKLAQSGVDENVMLTFISNSSGLFGLGSDEIIYLNDIGVANNVITTMIQRDQSLKQSWAETAQAQNAAAQANAQAAQAAQAAAPSYVEPPQPEPQPQPVAAGAAPPEQAVNVTYNDFHDSLSPYGTWVDVEGYGRCWQPTVVVVNRGWRPYSDAGRWMYTDAGWYWYSDYTWGWAPFHYGRWFSHPTWGWCWNPGYTWAPAWVSWRYNSGYCGWAPLPPAAVYTSGVGFSYYGGNVGVTFGFGLTSSSYSFVPWSGFYGHRPYKHCVPPAQAQQIYQNSTVINNYINGNNNTIINRGVPIDQVRRHAGTEIRQVAIRDTGSVPGNPSRRERLERGGQALAVSRPNAPQSDAATTPLAREQRNFGDARLPVAGAGAAAQLQSSRGQGYPRMSAEARDRGAQARATAPPLAESPKTAEGRTVAPASQSSAGNTRVAAPTVRSTPAASFNSARSKDNNRPSTASPLVVQGGERTTSTPSASRGSAVNAPATQKAPAGSLVVIGRRDPNTSSGRANLNETRSTSGQAGNSPQLQTPRTTTPAQTPRVSTARSAESLAFNRPSTPTPNRITPTARTFSSPVQSASSPRVQSVSPSFGASQSTPAPSRSMPSYSTPRSAPSSSVTIVRSSPTPAPSVSVSRSSAAPSPAPSYSAPRSTPSPSASPSFTPAPSRSSAASPAPSSSGRSDSGRQGSVRRN